MPSPQYNPRRQHKPVEKKPKRSGASPTRGERAAVNVPWWIWLAGGVAVGVFVSFLMKLANGPQPEANTAAAPIVAPKDVNKKTASTKNDKADAKADAANTGKAGDKGADKASGSANADEGSQSVTKFDFYTLLPEREVILPNEREAIKAVDKQKPQPGQAAPTGTMEQVLLQVGSFRSAQEAERRRAQVAALNLEARVESVRANGDTWYRVQAGPFTSREQLTKARDQLSAAGVESLLLKQKQG